MSTSALSSGAAIAAPAVRRLINPWIVAIVVVIPTFMEVLDTTIANVALRYISGGLAIGPDEAAWPRSVWINPTPQAQWDYSQSTRMLQKLFEDRMFPLTPDGIEAAMKALSH